MNRMSLNRKLWLALALVWVGLLGVGAWSAFETRTTMLAERKEGMANLVDSAAGVVKAYYALAQSGKMSDEDARRDALERIAAMRYGDSGYLFVMDSKPVVLMHPTLPKLVGTQVGDYLDPDGKRLFVTILNAAKAGGHGFAEYRGRLPHSETAVPKISYVTRFAPWDWNISSGVFLKDIDTVYYETLVGHLAVVFVIGLVITAAMLVIIRNVRASLGGEPDEAASLAARIAAGDLTRPVAVRAGDGTSMMAAMRDMQGRLRSTIGGIRRAAESIAAASHEIASGNHDLSQRTEQQAASLEETAASMEELTATVKQNAENARQASGLANNASEIALKGNDVVSRVIGTMGEINDSSRKIADIIGVIDGIAFQTNILALNAAVEAARVAGEVRALAQRSANAAKEIKALIGASVERVESGAQTVDYAGRTMGEIVSQVKRVSDLIAEISASTSEQRAGVTQVDDAVVHLDSITQQNAALVEQSAAASESLRQQATLLVDAVGVFR